MREISWSHCVSASLAFPLRSQCHQAPRTLQILPLIALALRRRSWSDGVRERLTLTAAGSYAGLFVLLLTQAVRGQSVVAPDGLTLTLIAGWAGLTAIVARWSVAGWPTVSQPLATVR